MRYIQTKIIILFAVAAAIAFSVVAAQGQTTLFTYQGRLTDSAVPQPTNGTYEMNFRGYTAAIGGDPLPANITLPTVQVVNGIFTVQLSFGSTAFNGADIFLQISARPAGSANPMTTLNPRQQFTSAPYALRSRVAQNANDAANLGGVAAAQYVQTGDTRLSDARDPLPGSASYIQNTNSVQPFASFNVGGNGTVGAMLSANIVNSDSQYNINNSRVLSVGGINNTIAGVGAGSTNAGLGNSFFGFKAGTANTAGGGNSFYGSNAGAGNLTASFNSFFGNAAGFQNNTGDSNAFFGFAAGNKNTSGSSNSFFGKDAGRLNTADSNSFFGYSAGGSNATGTQNSFFSGNAGGANTTGNANAFFGYSAGGATMNGGNNSFFGTLAGATNAHGFNNTLIGFSADVGSNSLSNATAIGAHALVTQSNSLILGSIFGVNGASQDTMVGIGTTEPTSPLTIKSYIGSYGWNHTIGLIDLGEYIDGNGAHIGTKTNSSLSLFVNDGPASLTLGTNGTVAINTLGVSGFTPLCLNGNGQISTCASDEKSSGARQAAGTSELGLLRAQVALQAEHIKQQQLQIDGLRKLICAANPLAEVCKEVRK